MDAVGREELVVAVAAHDVHLVVVLVAVDIGFLYRAARRGIIACHRKAQGRTVGVRYLMLHQTLAERAAADDGAAVVVLTAPARISPRRGAALVDKHRQRDVGSRTPCPSLNSLT